MLVILMWCSFKSQNDINFTPTHLNNQNCCSRLYNILIRKKLIYKLIHWRIFISIVFNKMLQTKTAINASRAMRNDFIWPKFLFKSNTKQPCLSNYTIPKVVQLKIIVVYCRRNARFLVHTSPLRKFLECAARFLIRPDSIQALTFTTSASKLSPVRLKANFLSLQKLLATIFFEQESVKRYLQPWFWRQIFIVKIVCE